METMNMKSYTVAQFTRFIKEQIEDGLLTPVIGIGKSGIGKTESIFELTKEMGIGFAELRLVTLTETDLLGIPTINEYGRTDWASNNLLPDAKRDGERGILVLDEVTSAARPVRTAAFQLMDSKRALGNYKLPDGWLVVALGNGPDDGGYFDSMEGAFLNRGGALRVEPDLKSWKKWAVDSGVNHSVVAFLSKMPEYLHKFDPDEIASVFPSPRSWTALSKRLNAREAKNGNKPLDRDDVEIYSAASVGDEVSSKFCAFYEYNRSIVDIDKVIEGKGEIPAGRIEPQVMYLTINSLVREVNSFLSFGDKGGNRFSEEAEQKLANTVKWLVKLGESKSIDMTILAIRDLSENVPNFVKLVMHSERFDKLCPELIEFATKNKIVLT